ncbi:MAG: phosphoribosylformylglycinamidine synthase II [Deltaproteobacteria bacterium CG11_big_fil_rev_8_21_14_0_20_49_13]|nr:MAG: phosphoribosylformylglycinamidine synthase II [Deltaproteobacteria bacterium CG11_big_fil_rev_8_21_14_0_20_49_13]
MKQDTKVTADVVKQHGLSDEEYERLKKALGREPNITELGIFSVMWSEHCSYKSSKFHLKKLPTSGPFVIQGPGENAGIIDIGDGLCVAFKMESHNHPSFIEPFQGAATGVGGILRDVFTMGARPIANLNSIRFGSADHPKVPYLLKGVVAGIAHYGNCMGIPTVGGEVYFDECYNGNNLVNAFTAGIVRKEDIFKGFASGVGNPVIYIGSKTGRDGIHGATMASDVFGCGNEERRPTVQVGDPFTEKLLLEACLEAMKSDAIVGIQDMGAAGLTSSSFEMASRAGTGIEMDLDKVPLREEGMTPYEIMLSESQERMLAVSQKGREQEIIDIFKKWDLDAEVVGIVTDDGVMRVRQYGKTVCELPIAPLVHAAPVYERPIKKSTNQEKLQKLDLKKIEEPKDYNAVLKKMIGSPNLACKSWVYRQYDHMVGTDTVVLPGSDAAVLRIKGTDKGVAMTVDCNPRWCYLDPYWGSAHAIAENARNLVASGAEPRAVTDCLNFGNPERPDIMWQFEQSCLGMAAACKEFGTPIVSGNVSFYNETGKEAIYPTPCVAMVGVLNDIKTHTSQFFKDEGDVIVLFGENTEELGGSEYLKQIHGKVAGMPPPLDFNREKHLHKAVLASIGRGIVRSAHDISDGGLAVAVAECAMQDNGKTIGAEIMIEDDTTAANRLALPAVSRGVWGETSSETVVPPIRKDALLFGEGASRMIITCKKGDEELLLTIAKSFGCPAKIIGAVGGKMLIINNLISIDMDEIYKLWNGCIEVIARSEATKQSPASK